MEVKEFICIACPVGCMLRAQVTPEEVAISGNQCKIGIDYGTKECRDPRRVLTTSIKVYNTNGNGEFKMLSVKTAGDIPKDKYFDCLKAIKETEVKGNIDVAHVIIDNVLGLNVDIVATRSVSFE